MDASTGDGSHHAIGEKRLVDFKLPVNKKHKPNEHRKDFSFLEDSARAGDDTQKEFIQVLDKVSLSSALSSGSQAPVLVIPLLSLANELTKRAAEELAREAGGDSEPGASSSSLIIPTSSNAQGISQQAPLLLAQMRPEVRALRDENDRFRTDVQFRAEDMDVKSSAYEAVPVELFGAALLRGMGWTGSEQESKASKKGDAIVPREQRLGLGALPCPPDLDNKRKTSQPTNNSWDKKAQEKLNQQQLSIGNLVWLRDAEFAGKRAVVTAVVGVPGLNKIRVALERNTEIVVIVVSRASAVLLTEKELQENPFQYATGLEEILRRGEEPAKPTFYGLRDSDPIVKKKEREKDKENDVDEDEDKEGNAAKKHKKHKHDKHGDRDQRDYHPSDNPPKHLANWLRTGIRVKIVSKKVGNGRAYLQKASVIDVPTRGVATLRLDDGWIVDEVKEKHLETVLPSVGSLCLILTGGNAGETAKLLEKQHDQEKALVELVDSLELMLVDMDTIAAFSLM